MKQFDMKNGGEIGKSNRRILLLIYVHDMILTGSNSELIDWCVRSAASFMNLPSRTLASSTTFWELKCITQILGSSFVNPTPYLDPTYYRSIVGALQYLTFTRLDIAYAVNYVRGPIYALSHIGHYQAVKRIIRYVGATMRILRHSSLDLYAFSDADWAGCFITRRSTTGFVRF
ncbi:uncharacterized mitochondrial protein AtMg00810-like [Rhododendron vialii]|uniref:uncharacterized mitochondrial protein AtMg00810-like n=1 Tax=Rhododendron vialii TaxID=182163 RepID=UPI00265EA305|nr:uncharacterized mitochondrial protein AtMg00810-like [Rhododendron vialii]XP_058217521.1 uncharacterized mitochondrial protein AtMg00810-like [Rhododendron vialii]